MRRPNLIACCERLPSDVVVALFNSQRFERLKFCPICEPPPLNAPATIMPAPGVVPFVSRSLNSYWKRVSFTVFGLMIIDSVNCNECCVEVDSVARDGKVKL